MKHKPTSLLGDQRPEKASRQANRKTRGMSTMMSAPTFRQSLTTVNARLGKTLCAPAARRSNANAALLRGQLSSSLRPTCTTRNLWTLSRAPSTRVAARDIGFSAQRAGSIRWKSGSEQRWRQWGFEDVFTASPHQTLFKYQRV